MARQRPAQTRLPWLDQRSRSRSLRRRIARSALGITSIALLLFVLPLAVAVQRLYCGEEFTRLQGEATRIVALVPDNPISAASRLSIPGDVNDPTVVGVYTPAGERVGGQGPARSAAAANGRDGAVHQAREADQLVVAVPVPSDRRIVAVVRAAVPASVVTHRVATSWAAMAVLVVVVLAVAAALTRRQARRIAQPLERLTAAAQALGDGDFTATVQPSGIDEADQAGAALAATAARLGRLLERERTFSANASHQLRTPLTGLLLGLESALQRPSADLHRAAHEAVNRGLHLQRTIDDLLTLARDTSPALRSVDPGVECAAAAAAWRPGYDATYRTLSLNIPASLPPVRASSAALRQILGVLLDNALQHGQGTVTITLTDLGAAVAVDVSDQGPGLSEDPETLFSRRDHPSAHGIGLPLARSLAEADGARLLVRRPGPNPVFTVLLPAAATVIATVGDIPPLRTPPRSDNPDPAPS